MVSNNHDAKRVNTQPRTNRAKFGIHKPRVFIATKEPLIIEETLQNFIRKTTMCDECLAFLRNNTWSLVELPSNRKAIGCKWIVKIKENLDGLSHLLPFDMILSALDLSPHDFVLGFYPKKLHTIRRWLLTYESLTFIFPRRCGNAQLILSCLAPSCQPLGSSVFGSSDFDCNMVSS